nr:MAG TPA: hypothetical protein [Caudoviricetes sp.]
MNFFYDRYFRLEMIKEIYKEAGLFVHILTSHVHCHQILKRGIFASLQISIGAASHSIIKTDIDGIFLSEERIIY